MKRRRVRYTTWHLIFELLKSINFLKRKFIFFFVLAGLGWGGFYLGKNLSFPAPKTIVEAGILGLARTGGETVSSTPNTLNLALTLDGRLLNKEANKTLKKISRFRDFDEIRYLVFDQPGTYLEKFDTYLYLPKAILGEEIKPQVYAIHGIAGHKEKQLDEKTLLFSVWGIEPQGAFTIAVQFPKNYFHSSPFISFFVTLKSLPLLFWLILSSLLPLGTFVFMLVMLARKVKDRRLRPVSAQIISPPADLPPAVVGVLLRGALAEREIAATLLDLLIRGHLNLYLKNLSKEVNSDFTFARRKGQDIRVNQPLTLFEKILLEKMSLGEGYDFKSTKEEINERLGHHLFSRKIAAVYDEVYRLATGAGFFVENPEKVHRRAKNFGLLAILLGFLVFLVVTLAGPDYQALFFSGAATILSGFIIIWLSANLPLRTPQGQEMMKKFLSFGKWLSAERPLCREERVQEKFIDFLPYAIVLEVENEWAQKFLKYPPSIPLWFDASQPARTIEEFYQQLMAVLAKVGREIVAVKEPTVV